ncbi:MAG: histidine kinase dimerization/phospho-acceptor domain-containing protein [Eisenbergiella massiliensis]
MPAGSESDLEIGRRRKKGQVKQLISDMSHQLKTPLANVLLYVEMLCRRELLRQAAGLHGSCADGKIDC